MDGDAGQSRKRAKQVKLHPIWLIAHPRRCLRTPLLNQRLNLNLNPHLLPIQRLHLHRRQQRLMPLTPILQPLRQRFLRRALESIQLDGIHPCQVNIPPPVLRARVTKNFVHVRERLVDLLGDVVCGNGVQDIAGNGVPAALAGDFEGWGCGGQTDGLGVVVYGAEVGSVAWGVCVGEG